MAADLEKLAQYHEKMGNQPKADLYLALAAEERANGVPETLAVSQQAVTPTESSAETPESVKRVSVFTRETFYNYLHEELKAAGQKITLPEPLQAIVEVHNILARNNFNAAPVIYVDRKKRKVTYGVIETVVRPDYTDGTQMYYSNPDEDPLAQILGKGRTGCRQRIAVPDWARHIPTKSRFAVSWDEIHNFIVPEVIDTMPQLKEEITKGGIVLRVPTKSEFQSAGRRYPHFGNANSWEWLYDSAGLGSRLFGGHRDLGGLGAVDDWGPGGHFDDVAFRLQAVSPSQELPR